MSSRRTSIASSMATTLSGQSPNRRPVQVQDGYTSRVCCACFDELESRVAKQQLVIQELMSKCADISRRLSSIAGKRRRQQGSGSTRVVHRPKLEVQVCCPECGSSECLDISRSPPRSGDTPGLSVIWYPSRCQREETPHRVSGSMVPPAWVSPRYLPSSGDIWAPSTTRMTPSGGMVTPRRLQWF